MPKPNIKGYDSALAFITDSPKYKKYGRRPINPRIEVVIPYEDDLNDPDSVCISFCANKVPLISYRRNGTIVINFNGLHAKSTRRLVREFTGCPCVSGGKLGGSIIAGVHVKDKAVIYTDGMVVPLHVVVGSVT